MPAPKISILLPLQDEREAGVECVRAWTDGQTAAGDHFEIIAVAIGDDRRLEHAVRPLLRDQDRWIEAPGIDEYEAFNAGAAEARGEFVFLTEAHCVPDRECMALTLEELESTGAPGLRAQSVPVNRGAFGHLESEEVAPALNAEEEDPEHWRRILIHGTALRRNLYLEIGGVPAEFGDFAPWAMSMQMREDQRPVLSLGPKLTHVYDGDFEKVEAFVRSFMAGEMLYRSEHPGELTDDRLPWSGEWEGQLEHTRSGGIRALRAGAVLRRGTRASLVHHLAVAVLGPRASVATVRARASLAKARARLARSPARRSSEFHSYWELTARQGRLEALAGGASGIPALPEAVASIDLTGSFVGRVIGFHQPERPDGEPPFRWTAPLALLRVNVPGQGRMRARLELRPSEWAGDAWVRVAVDNRAVPSAAGADSVEFEVESGVHWIALGSKPTRPGRKGGDRRVLGLPVRSLSFQPTDPQTPNLP